MELDNENYKDYKEEKNETNDTWAESHHQEGTLAVLSIVCPLLFVSRREREASRWSRFGHGNLNAVGIARNDGAGRKIWLALLK